MPSGWAVERPAGSIAERHGREPHFEGQSVLIHEISDVAIVVGSAQREVPVSTGIEVLRRRSGGGAVLLAPDELLWVDVVLPRGDPLWQDDVSSSVWWLGDAWRMALLDLGVEATVHSGPMLATRWSDRVCFAGVGPGEVLVGGRKVVGISQRRNRHGARFQCAVLLRWRPAEMVRLFNLEPAAEALVDLEAAAMGLGAGAPELSAAFLNRLP